MYCTTAYLAEGKSAVRALAKILREAYRGLDTLVEILEFLRRCLRVERDGGQVVYRLCSEEPPIDGGSLFVNLHCSMCRPRRIYLLIYVDGGKAVRVRRTEVRLPYDVYPVDVTYSDRRISKSVACSDASLSNCSFLSPNPLVTLVRVDDMYYVCLAPEVFIE